MKKACRILQLPDHILVEIFCKISAKTLTQCRFVCKSWHSFFKDPQLIKDLFSGTLPSPSSSLLIYGSTDCNNITSEAYHEDHFYFLIDCDKASTSRRRRHGKALNPCPKDLEISFCVEIVGSCNGLLCLNEPGLQFYISNPMTSEFSLLPISKSYLKKYSLILGFGFSPISNVYKVLDIYRFQESAKVEAMVMTVGSGIWRSIDANPIMSISSNRQLCRSLYGLCLYMTYLNGFLHWAVPSNGSLLIYAFDLETEQFQQLPHFDFESGGAPCNLGVLRGCLSVLVPNS
ncbi:PREDICTED: putative F-box protein At3g16210-like [Fragaria vesca subsp. vesca]